jgi:hypothetical protein
MYYIYLKSIEKFISSFPQSTECALDLKSFAQYPVYIAYTDSSVDLVEFNYGN